MHFLLFSHDLSSVHHVVPCMESFLRKSGVHVTCPVVPVGQLLRLSLVTPFFFGNDKKKKSDRADVFSFSCRPGCRAHSLGSLEIQAPSVTDLQDHDVHTKLYRSCHQHENGHEQNGGSAGVGRGGKPIKFGQQMGWRDGQAGKKY